METTLDLLNRAMLKARSERQLCFDLDLSESTLRKAREREHVSPQAAAALALYTGESVGYWALLSIAEQTLHKQVRPALLRAATAAKDAGAKLV